MKDSVKIWEVAPRDGLQTIAANISSEDKVHFVEALREAGLYNLEVGSFVSPKAVPAMANTKDVYSLLKKQGILEQEGFFSALVMNERGLKDALEAGANSVVIVSTVSDAFSLKNNGCSMKESWQRALNLCTSAKAKGIYTRLSLSPAWHCPYQGQTPEDLVIEAANVLAKPNPDEIVIADTIGAAKPNEVSKLFSMLKSSLPKVTFAAHFHDTYKRGMDNVNAALDEGIRIFDSSAGGIGGCPFAPGAKGNINTESLIDRLENCGYKTQIDKNKLTKASSFVKGLIHS